MEPFTITATCLGVVNHIFTLSNKIKDFVIVVREARSDMLGLTSELSTLSLSISMLQDDCTKIPFPESVMGDLSANLEDVLKKCESTTQEMIQFLDNYKSTQFLSGIRWAVNGRDELNRLKQKLESSKPTIGLALMVGQVILLKSIKDDTTIIKDHTTAIKDDTAIIPSVKNDTTTIIKILSDKFNLSDQQNGKRFVMERFYDKMTESVVDELDSIVWTPEMKPKVEPEEKREEEGTEIPPISLTTSELDPHPKPMGKPIVNARLEMEGINTELSNLSPEPEAICESEETVEDDAISTIESYQIMPGELSDNRLSSPTPLQLPQLSLEHIEPIKGFNDFGHNKSTIPVAAGSPVRQPSIARKLWEKLKSNGAELELNEDDKSSTTSVNMEEPRDPVQQSQQKEDVTSPSSNISNISKPEDTIDEENARSGRSSGDDVIPRYIERNGSVPGPNLLTHPTNEVPAAPPGTPTSAPEARYTDLQFLRYHMLSQTPTAELPSSCVQLMDLYLCHKRKDSSDPLHDCARGNIQSSKMLAYQKFDSSEWIMRQAACCGGLEIAQVVFEMGESEIFVFRQGLAVYCGPSHRGRGSVDILLDNKDGSDYGELLTMNTQKTLVLFENITGELSRRVGNGQVETVCLIFKDGVQISKILANPLLGPLELQDKNKAYNLFRDISCHNFTRIQKDEATCKAVQNGDGTMLDTLLRRYKNPNAKSSEEHVLCSRAAETGRVDLVKIVLNHKPTKSTTALRVACREGHLEVTRLLLDYGVNINGSTESGSTGLHFACGAFHLDVVKLLLSRGANVALKDRDGTPLDAAQKRLKKLKKDKTNRYNTEAWKCEKLIELLKGPTNVKKGKFW